MAQNRLSMNLARFPKFNRHKVWASLLICSTSLAVRADSPVDQAKLAAANTGFAFDLLKQIVKEQPDTNVFISPFSVSSVLQMVGNGAAGETKTEMQHVLKTGGLPTASLNAAYKGVHLDIVLNLRPGVGPSGGCGGLHQGNRGCEDLCRSRTVRGV